MIALRITKAAAISIVEQSGYLVASQLEGYGLQPVHR